MRREAQRDRFGMDRFGEKMGDKILVFVPMYNCEKQIPRVVAQFTDAVQTVVSELLILDNGSSDASREVAGEAIQAMSIPASVRRNRQNHNLGGSHKVAFDYAKENGFDYLVVLHGDDQGSIADLIPHVRKGEHKDVDCLLGGRFMPGSSLEGYSLLRTTANRGLNLLYSLLSFHRVYDLGAGLNMYSVRALAGDYYLMPLSLMLHMDLDPDTRDADLALIGRGINVDVLARYPDATAVPAWWQAVGELIPPNRTEEDHRSYFKRWISLVWHNPGAFLRARAMSYAMYYKIAPHGSVPIANNGYGKPAHEVPRNYASMYFLSTLYPETRQITPEAAKAVDRYLSLNYKDSLVGRLLFFLCYRSLYYTGPLLNILFLVAAIIWKNKPLLLLDMSLFYYALALFLAGPAVLTIYFSRICWQSWWSTRYC